MFNTIAAHAVSAIFLGTIGYFTYSCIGCFYLALTGLGFFFYIVYLLGNYVDNALPRFRVTATNKAVFITGCDKGFGRMLARRLDSMGYKVFAGCLDPDGEEAKKLKDTISSHLEVIPLDVTKISSIQNALKTVENKLGNYEFWAVVNNAGVIERGELEWTPLELYRQQFEVNTFGVVSVTQAFLPLLRKFKGRVVTMVSVGGRHTFSGFVPYCMSKHAVTSFCDGLRLEMKKFGVKVVTVEPFSYQTDMTEMKTVLKSIENTWEKCSTQLKNDVYDADYMKAFSDCVRKFNESTALPHIERVIDLLVEAVCAISPHYSYVPGNTESLLNLWLSKRAPKTLVDYFVRKKVTFDCDLEEHLKEKEIKKKNS
ncbi:retinol dehydrogenase 7-like [Argiope bruennichi]|uniref:Retinol dehydrogenase 7 like protein n=1 Tax=Argiope bruennichi TaxID=94029 RepID=A0A8T0FSN7_ARGBR|nr:retinol dehydrogenase 7-like [Argiope bruennichi]KAF8793642.1 Retinol dehydrogenase 7 like protein [Argiope bruennichi]